MKVGPLLGMTIAVALIVAPMVAQQPPLLVVWNASPSVPVGLYLVTKASPRVGDLVVLRLPPAITTFAARRRYSPTSAYLLKPIAAVAGDLVCRFEERVLVRGVLAGIAEGCRRRWERDAHLAWLPRSASRRSVRPSRSPRKLRQPLLRSARYRVDRGTRRSPLVPSALRADASSPRS